MTMTSRIRLIFKARAAHLLDKAEEPPEILDYVYAQQAQMLGALKRGLVEVSTARHQLEREVEEITSRAAGLREKAAGAMDRNREDLAKLLLERMHRALGEVAGMEAQVAELRAEESRLGTAQMEMSSRVEEFRLHRVVVSARYTAASAEAGMVETLAGMGGELAELSLAVGRAEEKTGRMLSRAAALTSLVQAGTLEFTFGADAVDAELKRLDVQSAVDADLEALRHSDQGKER